MALAGAPQQRLPRHDYAMVCDTTGQAMLHHRPVLAEVACKSEKTTGRAAC